MYNPGRNKVKAFFYDRSKFVEEQNEAGEYIQKPMIICEDWVEIVPMTGRQYVEHRKNETEMNYRLHMRNRKDIEVGDIVEIDGQKMDILYITSYLVPGRYMELVVQWQT